MDNHTTNSTSGPQTIKFSKGRSAQLIIAPGDSKAADIAPALGLPRPQSVVIVTGGADELDDALKPQLVQLFSRGIARAAVDLHAAIIDGGTHSGVMSLMGQGVADRGRKSPLIGVAPAQKVTYPGGPNEGTIEGGAALDPNHNYFVLVKEPEWGDEADLMYALAEELSHPNAAITVLVNGGQIAKDEVLRSVRHSWPIVVIEGSGRLADEIARYWKSKEAPEDDAAMTEIIAEGNIHIFSAQGLPSELRRLIVRQLYGNSPLRLAWERFAKYDSSSQRQQKSFSGLLAWTLWLGVLATALAVVHGELTERFPNGIPDPTALRFLGYPSLIVGVPLIIIRWLLTRLGDKFLLNVLKYTIIVVPITISILVAAANRFKTGKKWVLLRGSAEAIKREIFYYRTRTGIYSDEQLAKTATSRDVLLSQTVGNIARRVSQTEVNELALKRYDGSIPPPYAAAETDDGMSVLSPEAYIAGRLDDQVNYFESKAEKIEWQIKWRQFAIYIIGGLGTLLAAIEFQIWIAVTTAVATGLTAHLEHFQLESTLVKYNQSAADLGNVKSWWRALSISEKAIPANQTLLVESTEKILENELTGWVQRMQDAMEKIRAAADDDEQTNGVKDDVTPAPEKQHLCLAFISTGSSFESQYETIQGVIQTYGLDCKRVDAKTLSAKEIRDFENQIDRVELVLVDFSIVESNAYYVVGLANAKQNNWVALAQPGQSLTIEAGENGVVIDSGGPGKEALLVTQVKQALDQLGFVTSPN